MSRSFSLKSTEKALCPVDENTAVRLASGIWNQGMDRLCAITECHSNALDIENIRIGMKDTTVHVFLCKLVVRIGCRRSLVTERAFLTPAQLSKHRSEDKKDLHDKKNE